jgi:hypothetical protein
MGQAQERSKGALINAEQLFKVPLSGPKTIEVAQGLPIPTRISDSDCTFERQDDASPSFDRPVDSPPNEVVRLEVSLDIKEDCDGKEAIQA